MRVSLLMRMGLQGNDGLFNTNDLHPIAQNLLQNVGSNIYESTQNGRILENLSTSSDTTSKKSSLEPENVNELKCFVDEILGERKLSTGSIDGKYNTDCFKISLLKLYRVCSTEN